MLSAERNTNNRDAQQQPEKQVSQADPEASDEDPDHVHDRLPKGQRASIPNFNVCNPKGIPIIVTISSKLDIRYSTAVSNPPQISQMIFPKNFIASIL